MGRRPSRPRTRLGLCSSAQHDVEVWAVTIDVGPSALFHQAGTEVGSMAAEPEDVAPDLPTLVGPGGVWLRVDLLVCLDGCEWTSEGIHNSIDQVQVSYRYRGHDRAETVDLLSTFSVVSPSDDDCPRPRDHG